MFLGELCIDLNTWVGFRPGRGEGNMQKAASEPPDSTDSSNEEKSKHVMETHASSRLLQGQVERGELRAGTAAGRFQKAAKKVMVTKEVWLMLLDGRLRSKETG
jgi:hypothetical protein